MMPPVTIKYADAFECGVCSTTCRAEVTRGGLDWRTFVITGYSTDVLYAVFGADHLIIATVHHHVLAKQENQNG